MSTPSTQELIAIHLQYHAGTEALSVRAIAQLAAKLLYAGGRLVSKSPKEIANEAASVLGVAKVGSDSVEEGLAFLDRLKFVRASKDKWLLTDMGFSTIDADVRASKARVSGVLQRHFSPNIDPTALREWFTDATVRFYTIYGSQWAAALGRKTPAAPVTRDAITALLEETISLRGLKANATELMEGFLSFVQSHDPDDLAHHWQLGQALLAARLVAINIGPDPVTAREFHGALILLDTNTLLVTALENHSLAEPLERLGKVLQRLNVDLRYIENTRGEYRSVVVGNRTDFRKIRAAYPRNVLKDSSDAFISTALERGCDSKQDFEAFFDSLLDPPTTLGEDIPLEVLNDAQTLKLAEAGAADELMKAAISDAWATRRRMKRKKAPRAVEHDAALVTVAEGLNKAGRRCVVLTLDRTMHEYALTRAGMVGLPQWVALDALIQILAVDSAGPELDPSQFAPLLASIIRHQCEPIFKTYTAQDLAIMLDVEDRCAALTEPEIKRIASVVSRERLQGRARNDPEISLAVHRAFETAKVQIADENRDLREEIRDQAAALRGRDETLVTTRGRSDRATELAVESLAEEVRTAAHRKGLVQVIASAGLTVVWIVGALRVATHYFPNKGGEWFGIVVALIAFLAPLPFWLRSEISTWRTTVSGAKQSARLEIDRELDAARE